MSYAILNEDDREFFAGPDIGWTKQLRLALVFGDAKSAIAWLGSFRSMSNAKYRLVNITWRIRNRDGSHICSRGTIFEGRRLLEKYANNPPEYPGWAHGPYKLFRVAQMPRKTTELPGEKQVPT